MLPFNINAFVSSRQST